ncbi:MAG: DUF4340 domain-containing protein [Planctomycetaceae bacterium]
MNETNRTMMFVIAAAVSLSLAAVAHIASQPSQLSDFERVGTEFYPDFQDPNQATALKVIAYDEDTASVRDFEVQFKNGLWLIPSHHGYPADGKDRLAKTAASIIGIKRGALESRYEADHERLGVVDPMNQDVATLKGRGQRVTLTKGDDTVLADFIIGKKVEGETDSYYVRHPQEKETYRTALSIDLSTKFADWIEPDLLDLDRNNLREIVVNKYSVDEQRGRIVDREVSRLTRTTSTEDWKLEGLKAETEEVNADEVRKMVGSLDDLRIVGVRPKPSGLNADLTIDKKVVADQLVFTAMSNDMARRGFLLYQDDKNALQLASNEGEIIGKSNDGIAYSLHFGEIFSGDTKEIEIGGTSDSSAKEDKKGPEAPKAADAKDQPEKSDQKDAADGEKAKTDAAAGESKDGKKPDDKSNLKRSRYLLVSVEFDPKLVGEAPVKPTEPAKPPESAAGEAPKDAQPPATNADGEKTDAKSDDAPKAADESPKADSPAADPMKDNGQKPDDKKDEQPADEKKPDAEKPKDPKAEYDEKMKQYQQDLQKYEQAVKDQEKKIDDGRKKFERTKTRFGAWYYVISAESFENLRLARKDLVKPKEAPKTGNETKPGTIPATEPADGAK